MHDFKILPYDGALEFYDDKTGSSFSYDGIKKELISYDNLMVVKQKAAWIQKKMGLGGAMWWESSADREGNQSLIQNVADALSSKGSGLESSLNQLLYADSPYDNLRACNESPDCDEKEEVLMSCGLEDSDDQDETYEQEREGDNDSDMESCECHKCST